MSWRKGKNVENSTNIAEEKFFNIFLNKVLTLKQLHPLSFNHKRKKE